MHGETVKSGDIPVWQSWFFVFLWCHSELVAR